MGVVFDVDGTLLDTYQVVRASYIDVFNKYLPNLKYDEDLLKSFFGPPLFDTFYQVTKDENFSKKLIEYYRLSQKEISAKLLKPFLGAKELISDLHKKGIKLGILSNKAKEAIIEGFNTVGLPLYFEKIIGVYDIANPKPFPDGLLYFKDLFREDIFMVGDSVIDIKTAQNANVKSIAVTWGITETSILKQAQADWIVDSFPELSELIIKLHK